MSIASMIFSCGHRVEVQQHFIDAHGLEFLDLTDDGVGAAADRRSRMIEQIVPVVPARSIDGTLSLMYA